MDEWILARVIKRMGKIKGSYTWTAHHSLSQQAQTSLIGCRVPRSQWGNQTKAYARNSTKYSILILSSLFRLLQKLIIVSGWWYIEILKIHKLKNENIMPMLYQRRSSQVVS